MIILYSLTAAFFLFSFFFDREKTLRARPLLTLPFILITAYLMDRIFGKNFVMHHGQSSKK